jgi:hypothetical protein
MIGRPCKWTMKALGKQAMCFQIEFSELVSRSTLTSQRTVMGKIHAAIAPIFTAFFYGD